MNQSVSAAATSPDALPNEATNGRSIITRFGELTIDEHRIINFIDGLYGLEQHRQYLLSNVPDWPEVFKLLQAVNDPKLSLIVLPLEGAGGPIDRADFAHACQMLGFKEEATTVLGIVTMRANSENQVFTVNLKAPLLIDTGRRLGRQHVFASEKYHLRHPLPVDQDREG